MVPFICYQLDQRYDDEIAENVSLLRRDVPRKCPEISKISTPALYTHYIQPMISWKNDFNAGDHWIYIHRPLSNQNDPPLNSTHPTSTTEEEKRWDDSALGIHMENRAWKIVPACLACDTYSIELPANQIAGFLGHLVLCIDTQQSLQHDISILVSRSYSKSLLTS